MADTYEFRFRRRYGLPPTDPRFLRATFEEIVLDYWAHEHMDDPKLRDEIITDDFEAQLAEMEAELAAQAAEAEANGEAPAPIPTISYPMPERPEGMEDDFEEVFADKYA